MLLTTFYRITKMSLKSLWRNRWLSLAATLIMILTLITISFFVSMLVITGKTTQQLREKVDMSVYFNDTASSDQITAIQSVLTARSDVKSVQYISKEDALATWKKRNSEDENIQNLVSETDNPLPRSLEIKTRNPEDLDKINTLLSVDEYDTIIKEISYRKNKDLVDRLVRISTFVKIVGWSLSAVFVLIAILIIYNTIRLTIFARAEEVEIMKLVGGSDWYVRGPFIVDGISYGLLGAIISSIIYFFFFRFSIPVAERYLGLADLNSSYLGINFLGIIALQIFLGIALGAICSIVAIRKHLS